MVNKDSTEKDTTDKKRRKGSSADAASSKQSKEDIYESVITHEEQEAQRRTADKDMALFHHTCGELKKIFEEVSTLKKDNTEKSKQEIQEKRIQGSLIFVLLKKLNRLDKIRIRAGRDALHKEKLRVDSNRLQLQNLLYEANHLKREVQRCYQFKSQDEEIDLVPVDEFYANAPETISRPEKTKTDEHAKRLARLEWELQQRKELAVLCKELTISKENVSKDIASKTERLEFLVPGLEALLKATRPLQTALDMELEKEWEIQKSAKLLPRPLYLVYANLSAYHEACEPNLSVVIEGDEDEAKQLEDEQNDRQEEDENLDSDNEDSEIRKKHHKRLSKSDTLEIKKKMILKPHPLTVTFKLNKANGIGTISIILRYFTSLGFITAKPDITIENIGVAAGDVVSPENILNCLYPDDFGDESPNPKTKYQLSKYEMNESTLLERLAANNYGKPFKWVQRLCGLEFNNTKPSTSAGNFSDNLVNTSHELCHESVSNIIKLIKSRWNSRLGLFKQIHSLENKNVDCSVDSTDGPPIRISSSLVQWSTISWEEYSSSQVTQRFIEENLTTIHDLRYRAVITRGSAKLECLISISSNFPVECPIWALCLFWNGKHDATNNSAIRDMEFWVNSMAIPRNASSVLSAQLRRIMSCLDIFLETEGPHYSPAEFTQDKTFLKAFRGRNRSRPYKIVQSGSSVIYKQI